MDPKWCCYFTQ